jgi:hypothetical protein
MMILGPRKVLAKVLGGNGTAFADYRQPINS